MTNGDGIEDGAEEEIRGAGIEPGLSDGEASGRPLGRGDRAAHRRGGRARGTSHDDDQHRAARLVASLTSQPLAAVVERMIVAHAERVIGPCMGPVRIPSDPENN